MITDTEIGVACGTNGVGQKFEVLVVKPEGNSPLERPGRRRGVNIKIRS